LLGGPQLMSSHAKQVPCDIMDSKKALGLRSRFEAAHVTLASPCGLGGRLKLTMPLDAPAP